MAMRAWLLRAEARLTQLEAWRKAQNVPQQQDLSDLIRRIEELEAKAHTHNFGRPSGKKDSE